MPIAAWIDERHLAPLGLSNGWGYNPVAFLAPDPRLCPGGLPELAATVAALRDAGIGTILDVVFNHTGEGDAFGPTLSLRGLDNAAYFRHEPDGRLVNDAGTGNTLACDHPATRRLILDALRHFVGRAGVDGFRFDLAPVLARTGPGGFDPNASLLNEMAADPLLADRIMIAEPWDIGPGGYQLGRFPPTWLEWNDRYRDRVRRFWRGDPHMLGEFATALAGSSDTFPPPRTRTVNFIAAHDGFTLADLVAYRHKHNAANGEAQPRRPRREPLLEQRRRRTHRRPRRPRRAPPRPEGAARDPLRLARHHHADRRRRVRPHPGAATTTPTPRTTPTTWLDWQDRDRDLEAHAAALAALRRAHPAPRRPALLTGAPGPDGIPDVAWLTPGGTAKTVADWENAHAPGLTMLLGSGGDGRLAVMVNRSRHAVVFHLPARPGHHWPDAPGGRVTLGPRAVAFAAERPGGPPPTRRRNRASTP